MSLPLLPLLLLLLLQYGYCRIDGNTGGDDREYMIDEYNRPDSSK